MRGQRYIGMKDYIRHEREMVGTGWHDKLIEDMKLSTSLIGDQYSNTEISKAIVAAVGKIKPIEDERITDDFVAGVIVTRAMYIMQTERHRNGRTW